MIHHPGKVIAVIRPNDKSVISADEITLAVVEMWDYNVLTLVVDNRISKEIKEGDIVLVDYRPKLIGQNNLVPRQRVVKIVRGSKAQKIWETYREYYKRKKDKSLPPYAGQQHNRQVFQ